MIGMVSVREDRAGGKKRDGAPLIWMKDKPSFGGRSSQVPERELFVPVIGVRSERYVTRQNRMQSNSLNNRIISYLDGRYGWEELAGRGDSPLIDDS